MPVTCIAKPASRQGHFQAAPSLSCTSARPAERQRLAIQQIDDVPLQCTICTACAACVQKGLREAAALVPQRACGRSVGCKSSRTRDKSIIPCCLPEKCKQVRCLNAVCQAASTPRVSTSSWCTSSSCARSWRHLRFSRGASSSRSSGLSESGHVM